MLENKKQIESILGTTIDDFTLEELINLLKSMVFTYYLENARGKQIYRRDYTYR
jgi:hypothetical protein